METHSMRKRKRRFVQKMFPIKAGNMKDPLRILRFPEDMSLPPADIPSYLYEEEYTIAEDEVEGTIPVEGQLPPSAVATTTMKRKRRIRPSLRWVFEGHHTKLHGTSSFTSKQKKMQSSVNNLDQGSSYFIMKVDETNRETCLMPIQDIIFLRQVNAEEEGLMTEAVRDYIETGRKFNHQARQWEARYGKALVAALTSNVTSDEEGHDGVEYGKRRGSTTHWQRTYRVDEDGHVADDSFNPNSKVAPNYNEILGLMTGDKEDYEREALEKVFAEVDTGLDEMPDGADAGFGAPEFGVEENEGWREQQAAALAWQEEEEDMLPFLLEDDDNDEEIAYSSSSSEEEEGSERRKAAAAGQQSKSLSFPSAHKHDDFDKGFSDMEEGYAGSSDDDDESSSSSSAGEEDK